jgi:hypothetical protein
MEDVAAGHKFEKGPSKDHPSQAWFNLVQTSVVSEKI